ncbi:hypothetical protein [Vibrio europaeus]|uniref:hypothetical protein n=1 Tax=Vibrio europaeus TaxID=300876 RepID=UPI00148DC2B1|nr:hypothetical protein [Vibrio europaeus]NOH26340.1 hypothetical protein [Vibrio europaeus]
MSAQSLLMEALDKVYGRVSSKLDANRLYKVLVPALHSALESNVPLADPQMTLLIEAIADLPPSGARARNFKNRYLKDRDSMMRLPKDPNSIMYGYWW